MSKINIVLGSHGSGKSKFINDKIFNLAYDKDGSLDLSKKIFLIVPEQDNFMKQKEIINYEGNKGQGILNVDCISFDRLVYMVFEKTGENYQYANDDLKVLIIRLAINELKKENTTFKYFDFEHDNIGVYSKIKSALSEFSNYGINENVLDILCNNIKNNNDLNIREKNKIEDLKIIQKKYYEILDKKGFKISEEKLSLLDEEKLKLIFNDSYCFFDGFTGFTPLQRDTFKKMIYCIKEAYISVDLRIDEKIKIAIDNYNGNGFLVEENDIFNLSVDFIKNIEIIRQDLNLKEKIEFIYPIKEKLGECIKYEDKNDFKIIEKNIFNENKIKNEENKLENIVIFKAYDVKNEVELVANQIIKIIKNDKDITFDDIKIVTPDINVYKSVIIDVFNKKGLPLFIDDEKDVLDSPLISSVKNLIMALKNNFMNDTIMKYIKSGLYSFNDELFYLDNLAKEYNLYNLDTFENRLNNYKLLNAENKEYYHKKIKLDKIIELEKEIIKPLKNAKEKLVNTENPINTYVDIIKTYLKEEAIIKRYQRFIISVNNNDEIDMITKKMLTDNMDILNNILDKLSIVNDDDNKITIDVFLDLFNLCLESIHYKTIPMQLNQIVAGDLIRSRYNNPKILFFVGMNESLLPPEADDTNIINDTVRDIFEKNNYELSFTNFKNTINTKFYTYLAVTSPTYKLYLSYSELNKEGYSDFKSFYLTEIENIFKKDKEDKLETIIEPKEKILYSKNEATEFVRIYDDVNLGDKDKEKIKELKDKIGEDKFSDVKVDSVKKESIDLLFDKKNYKEDNKNKDEVTISTTSVEAYAYCPFKYFAEKLLNIYKREDFAIESNLIGNVNHNVMQKIDEVRSNASNKEVYDLLTELDKNKSISSDYLDEYFKNLKDNKYKLDKDKFFDILNHINEDCKNKKDDMEYKTISYDIEKKELSIISLSAIINDTTKFTKFAKYKNLIDDIQYVLGNTKKFHNYFKILESSYIKNDFIKKLENQFELYMTDELNSDEGKIKCNNLKDNIDETYYIMKDFVNLCSSSIKPKNIKNYRTTFDKYSSQDYSIVHIYNSLGENNINVFLDEIKRILLDIKTEKDNKINVVITSIVDNLIKEMFYINDKTDLKSVSTSDYKNDRKFKDSKLGEFLLIRTKEVLSKTLYNLVINDIYRMDSILSKVEYEINKYKITYDNTKGEGKDLDLKVLLNGRIDKFIVGNDNNNIYIEIVDYKSSNKTVSLNDINTGKDLRYIQTLIYLSYLLESEDLKNMIIENNIKIANEKANIVPVGSFYQGIIDEYDYAVNEDTAIEINADSYKMTGVLNKEVVNVFEKGLNIDSNEKSVDYNIKTYNQGDSNAHNVVTREELNESITLLKNHIIEKVNEIKNGNISPNPHKGFRHSTCSYCNLKSLCKREEKFDMEEDSND